MERSRFNTFYHNGNRETRRGRYQRGSGPRERYQRFHSRVPYRTGRNKVIKKVPSRPMSPVEGSEEYMTRKIQHTSAIIMRHLLSPNEAIPSNIKDNNIVETAVKSAEVNELEKINEKNPGKTRKPTEGQLSVNEIHEKIINHVTNLNDRRKKSFINANTCTDLDNAINQMYKRKRLEISRILRGMNSSTYSYESTNMIESDIGIKIEDLPTDIIEELKEKLNLDLEYLDGAIAESLYKGPTGISLTILDEPDIAHSSHDKQQAMSGMIVTEPNQVLADSSHKKQQEIPIISRLDPDQALQSDQPENPVISLKEFESDAELNAAVHSIEIKQEPAESLTIEIKKEDISETCEIETIDGQARSEEIDCSHSPHSQPDSDNDEFNVSTLHHSFCVKEDDDLRNISIPEIGSWTSESTIPFQNPDASDNNGCSQLKKIETKLKEFVHNNLQVHCTDVDVTLGNIELVDLCVRHLESYKKVLISAMAESSRSSARVTNNTRKLFSTQSSQTLDSEIEENRLPIKRKRIHCKKKPEEPEVKQEDLSLWENEVTLKFPQVQERIVVIERIGSELLLATESGNIIFVSLIDGSFQHTLGVTKCPITSLTFVRGINDFIYMYVGSLQEVLRVYDLRKRQSLRVSSIHGQIRCMDAMWDYVFMGCSNGNLIRYSCKKMHVEREETNTGGDILVLKAAQEGPRKVLLVGHRQAPIYVRDAMSGLYLRNFSNQAITPTVYSIVVDNSNIYCGTAKDNILVFSFHEGHLKEKVIADDSKGISCLKVFKNLLFAGCYNGSIYVYNMEKKRLLSVLNGPGGGILCMQVLSKQVIVGTLTNKFESIAFPDDLIM